MNILQELKNRFAAALAPLSENPQPLLDMVKPAGDARFGDYQANCAMPLGKQLGKPPRDVAAEIVARLDVSDLCDAPEIAGPGFINLRLRDSWLVDQLARAIGGERLGVAKTADPKSYVIDYSAPNVAKPMHVGHIRSTVIGDALCRTLRFLGHQVVSDNHLGDWGTQFGMVIYGYKHFVDRAAYEAQPVAELSRLYKLVHQLVEYHAAAQRLPAVEATAQQRRQAVEQQQSTPEPQDKAAKKKAAKALRQFQEKAKEAAAEVAALQAKIQAVQSSPHLAEVAGAHAAIGDDVLAETSKLHAGDPQNAQLWEEFLPKCKQDIQRIYDRLDIQFDYEYGESFYHDQLAGIVEDFQQRGLATESEGAVCVFLDGFDAPMIVRKKDGAFLYATTDLATIAYRMKTWRPDAILYVVDHRQSEHFAKLFAAARKWGCDGVDLRHISFGTVLGEDGKPFKTRAGDTVGLKGLLDEAVGKALQVVSENDDAKPGGPEIAADDRASIAEIVGCGAIKYADLSHNRTSDYVFSYDKMLTLEGNTATYMQYSYARVQSIFRRGQIDVETLSGTGGRLQIAHPAERSLALAILRFAEALDEVVVDFRPNQLTAYLFELAKRYSTFFEQCPVLKAESDAIRNSRLLLCSLTGRTIKQGMALLGIGVVDKM